MFPVDKISFFLQSRSKVSFDLISKVKYDQGVLFHVDSVKETGILASKRHGFLIMPPKGKLTTNLDLVIQDCRNQLVISLASGP